MSLYIKYTLKGLCSVILDSTSGILKCGYRIEFENCSFGHVGESRDARRASEPVSKKSGCCEERAPIMRRESAVMTICWRMGRVATCLPRYRQPHLSRERDNLHCLRHITLTPSHALTLAERKGRRGGVRGGPELRSTFRPYHIKS